ncbi:hypothetical protein JCM6882_008127 [Rhodosporidiobolus microsporus]
MPKVIKPAVTVNSYTTDNRNARHLSCEGCRKRKMKCSRTSPCVACTLRGQECVWLDTKPSHGVAGASVEDNEREIIRLYKIIDQLQAVIIEREGKPWYPPLVAPPTPPSYVDHPYHHTSPRFFDAQIDPYMPGGALDRYYARHGVEGVGGGGGPSFWGGPDGRPARLPPKVYSVPPRLRYDSNGDYIVSPSGYPSTPRYPPFAAAPFAGPSSSSMEPAASHPWTFGPHARASTWSGPAPEAYSSSDPPSFPRTFSHQEAAHLSPPAPEPSLRDFSSLTAGHQPFDASFSAAAAGGLPDPSLVVGRAAAASRAAVGDTDQPSSSMLSQLPKLDTDVSLHLPSTVSALLTFTANPVDDSLNGNAGAAAAAAGGEGAFGVDGFGAGSLAVDDEWKTMVMLPEEQV